MEGHDKSTQDLFDELEVLRKRNAELEELEAERRRSVEESGRAARKIRDVIYMSRPRKKKDQSVNPSDVIGKFLWLGLFFAFLFWFLESAIHTFVFGKPDYLREVFTPGAHENWMRLMVMALFVIFGGYVQVTIHRRKLAEQLIEQERARMSTVLASLETGLTLINPDMTISYVNPKIREMFPKGNPIGRHCFSFYESRTVPCEQCATIKAFETGKVAEIEVYNQDRGRWFLTVSQPITDDAGKVVNVLESITDITRLKVAELKLRESEQKINAMLQSIGDFMCMMDVRFNVIWVNDNLRKALGRNVVGRKCYEALHGRKTPCAPQPCLVMRAFADGGTHEKETEFTVRSEKKYYLVRASVALKDENGNPTAVMNVARDITERKQMEDILKTSEERYRTVADYAYDWELWQDPEGKMRYVSPSCERITGYPAEKFIEDPTFIERIIHSEDLPVWKHHMTEYSEESIDYRIHRKDGRIRWLAQVSRRVLDEMGNPLGLRCSMRDITDRKHMEQQLQHQALHDPLTGLANRTLCLDRIQRNLVRIKNREGRHFAVAFIDLDRFKVINESLGHAAGDRILLKVRDRLQECVRPLDTVARFGGDEFVILIEEIKSPREAIGILKTIRQYMRTPFTIDGHEVQTTVSIGIVLGTPDFEKPEDILQNAHIAMQRAKEKGRDRMKVFNSRMLEQAISYMTLEADMRRGIGKDEFFLVYQPIVDIKTSGLIGFEALVRWHHPQKGLMSPGEFIPIAEETGMIVELGLGVLKDACSTMSAWCNGLGADNGMFVSVNLSARQFSQPGLVHNVRQILGETKLTPENLKLEITESAIMENPENAIEKLTNLKTMGVNISIDDFGTGYSSMSYLQRFPIDHLKIDYEFISKVDKDSENLEIVKAIISLAHSLGLKVVAEGIERVEQKNLLSALNCDYGQGFLFSRPVDRDEAERLMSLSDITKH